MLLFLCAFFRLCVCVKNVLKPAVSPHTGREDAEDGRAADDGGDRPAQSRGHREADRPVGGEPGEVVHRPVSLPLLHCLPARH